MEIKPHLTSGANAGPAPVTPRTVEKTAVSNADSAQFRQVDSLENELGHEPSIRSEEVKRAAELIADPSWPSSRIQQQVAGLLADHLGQAAE